MLPLNVDCNFNFLFSFFSARLRMAQGQERDRVKELSYDYVRDGEDSTDGKWVESLFGGLKRQTAYHNPLP